MAFMVPVSCVFVKNHNTRNGPLKGLFFTSFPRHPPRLISLASCRYRAIQHYFLVILGFSEGRFTTVLVIQNPKITKDHFTVFDRNALSKSRIDTKQCFKTYSTHLNTFISVIKSTVVFKQCHVSWALVATKLYVNSCHVVCCTWNKLKCYYNTL